MQYALLWPFRLSVCGHEHSVYIAMIVKIYITGQREWVCKHDTSRRKAQIETRYFLYYLDQFYENKSCYQPDRKSHSGTIYTRKHQQQTMRLMAISCFRGKISKTTPSGNIDHEDFNTIGDSIGRNCGLLSRFRFQIIITTNFSI